MTLIPEMSKTAGHVTMLQRSPTYVVSRPAEDAFANKLRRHLPAMLAYRITRWRNVLLSMYFYNLSRRYPARVKAGLIDLVRKALGPDYDVGTHFTPRYNPWDQRLCLVPDDDLFTAIKSGRASVATDEITKFDATGLRLKSGQHIDADVIVTATGLKLLFLAGLDISVDGKHVDFAKRFTYKGMMYNDVPNLAASFGYTNASWTLKCDLTCEYVCRLLNHMDKTGTASATPRVNENEIEPDAFLNFSSGYVLRAIDQMPKQGKAAPWKLHQNYALDLMGLRFGKLDDGVMEFTKKARVLEAAE
jgi:cation diffusion facilitator CzcD-associated flavoprotein CzcO